MAVALLLRHGNSTSNSAGTLAGWTPGVTLDDRGRTQAREAAARLACLPLVRVVTSPLERCRQTTQAVLDALADEGRPLEAQVEHDLVECRYGAWTGRPIRELAQEPLWRTVQDQPSAAVFPPSQEHESESLAAMAARAVAAVRRIDAEVEAEHGPTALWLAVSHGDIIKAVLADAAGTHLDQFQRLTAAPASVSVVHYTARRPFLVTANSTGPLADLLPQPPKEGAAEGDAVVGGGTRSESAD